MKILVENLNSLESSIFIRHFNLPSIEFVVKEDWGAGYKSIWLNLYFWKWIVKIKLWRHKR